MSTYYETRLTLSIPGAVIMEHYINKYLDGKGFEHYHYASCNGEDRHLGLSYTIKGLKEQTLLRLILPELRRVASGYVIAYIVHPHRCEFYVGLSEHPTEYYSMRNGPRPTIYHRPEEGAAP